MRILRGILAVAAVIGFHGPGLAQQAPGPDELASALGLGMPSWWTVGTVEIQAAVNDGDDIAPRYRQRFTADVVPREDLYRLVDKVDPFSVVAAVTPAGTSYRLYGIGHSALEKGKWSTKLEMENSVAALGQPRSIRVPEYSR